MTIAKVLRQEKQIVKSNTIQAHYELHTNNVNVDSSLMTSVK